MKRFLFPQKNVFMLVLLIPLVMSFSGCIYLLVGGIGAVGGYIVSPDTVEGITSKDEDVVWDAVVKIVSIMGTIEEEIPEGGTLIARVNNAKVTVTVMPINESTVKLSVKARKHFFPKITVAQDVFVKIMNYLQDK